MRSAGAVGMVAGAALPAAALLAWGARGRSSELFGPSVYRGPAERRAVALTFDDGPSESTPELLEILARNDVKGTFFQCGANVRRLPEVSRSVLAAGHEIGNHSETHEALYLKSRLFIRDEFARAQQTFGEFLGVRPGWMRAPFGVRWFGFRAMQRELSLTGVMWTVIGLDWRLPAPAIAQRVEAAARNGAIICLHDGRELNARPAVRETLEAVRRIIPALLEKGYEFQTVGQLLCPKN